MSQASRKSILKSSIVVSFATLMSRVLGLTRDIVFAAMFGSGGAQDAFIIAFKIPNFLRRLFAEGAFNQAFVPVLSEYRQSEGDDSVRKLVGAIQIYLGGVVGLITLVAVLASPLLAWLFAPGFHGESGKLVIVSDLLRITFPYLWFISLTALASSVLNSYGRFAAPALTPIILNLSLIGSAFWLSPYFEIKQTGIAFGVLIAGLLQWLFLWPSLLKTGVWRPWEWHRKHPGVKKIGLLMIPGLFAVSVSQINLLLDTVLASMLEDGSVTWLYFSDRLTELPLGVFGIAIATVLLPRLSALHADSDPLQFEKTLAWAIRLVIMIGLPAAIALALIPDVLITLLFENGKFNAEDVRRSAPSLAAYAFGLPAFMLIKVLAPAFFARQDTKTPVKIGIQAMVWNMVFNLMLIIPFAHVGLAAATSMSAWLNACLLAWYLRKDKRLPSWQSVSHSVSRTLLACLVMAGVILWLMSLAAMQMPADLIGQIRVVSVFVGAGMASYAFILLVTGVKLAEIRHP